MSVGDYDPGAMLERQQGQIEELRLQNSSLQAELARTREGFRSMLRDFRQKAVRLNNPDGYFIDRESFEKLEGMLG